MDDVSADGEVTVTSEPATDQTPRQRDEGKQL